MITLKRCRELIDKGKKKFSDEQLEKIRQFLIQLAQLNVEIINQQKLGYEKSSHHEQG